MDKKYAVYIGDVAMDEYYRAPYWPAQRDKVMVETLPPQLGGTVANAACVYAGYGQPTHFFSMLNNSPASQLLCENLRQQGIDTDYILRDDSLPDSKTMIYLVGEEHTIFIPVMNIKKMDILPEALEMLCNAEYIYSTMGPIKTLCSGDMSSLEILKKARARGAKVAFDLDVCHPGSHDAYLMSADILFFNELGFNVYRGEESCDDTVNRLLGAGVSVLVVTLGENGCRVHTKDGVFTVPGIHVTAVDVTGAGDTFCSSFLYALSESGDLTYAAEFANAAASRAVTIFGPRGGVSNKETVVRFLQQNKK